MIIKARAELFRPQLIRWVPIENPILEKEVEAVDWYDMYIGKKEGVWELDSAHLPDGVYTCDTRLSSPNVPKLDGVERGAVTVRDGLVIAVSMGPWYAYFGTDSEEAA